jgi:hypothetical protein
MLTAFWSIFFLYVTSPSNPLASPDQRTALLLEAVGLLVEELALLATQDWEKLPDLKKRKVVAASRLRRLRAETEAADGAPARTLESLIEDLDVLSQGQIRSRLAVIGNQMLALQELSLYLLEAQHINLRRTASRPLGNGSAMS